MRAVGALSPWDASISGLLRSLEQERLLRVPRPVERAVDPVLVRDGRRLLNFSSNNYLGLAGHPRLAEAVARGAAERGAGATASRLVVGSDRSTAELEAELAAFKGTEAALLFGSGYAANLGLLSALLERDDAVLADRLCHASIWDGIRLSGARLYRYRHRDLGSLEAALARAERDGARRLLVVTESVFGMDGDVAPLAEIVELAQRHGACLAVDDAHGGGVYGARGEGLAHELGLAEAVDLHVGTLSKAFGVYGGYVAGRRDWIRYLASTARSFLYTTALPPALVEAARVSLELVCAASAQRGQLRRLAERFRDGVHALSLESCGSTTQIVPAVVGEAETALAVSRALERRGVLGVAIRPPTVPRGAARIRFSLTAAHSEEDVERALVALAETCVETGVGTG